MKKKPQDWYIEAFVLGGRKREEATSLFMQENIGLIHSMRSKFKLAEEEALDLFTDAFIGAYFSSRSWKI